MDKPQKAYMVSIKGREADEGGAEIVIAGTPGEAKAHITLDYDSWTDLRAVRKPQFDQYASRGSVPTKALLADGWWVEEKCRKCGRWVTVNQSYIDDGELRVEFDERGEIKTVTCFDCIEKAGEQRG